MQQVCTVPTKLVLWTAVALAISIVAHLVNIIPYIRTFVPTRVDRPSPPEFPVPLRPVAMTVALTNRYRLHSDDDWSSLTPIGDGFVRLPGTDDYFAVALYHQLHCLNSLRKFMAAGHNLTIPEVGHADHCLIYLRQALLCNADVTLEPTVRKRTPDGRLTNAVTGIGVTHRCRDWTQVRDYMELNYEDWKDDPEAAIK